MTRIPVQKINVTLGRGLADEWKALETQLESIIRYSSAVAAAAQKAAEKLGKILVADPQRTD